jgi:hypothetical protein
MADPANPEMTKQRIQVAVSWPLFLLKMVLGKVLHTDKSDRSERSERSDKSNKRDKVTKVTEVTEGGWNF